MRQFLVEGRHQRHRSGVIHGPLTDHDPGRAGGQKSPAQSDGFQGAVVHPRFARTQRDQGTVQVELHDLGSGQPSVTQPHSREDRIG